MDVSVKIKYTKNEVGEWCKKVTKIQAMPRTIPAANPLKNLNAHLLFKSNLGKYTPMRGGNKDPARPSTNMTNMPTKGNVKSVADVVVVISGSATSAISVLLVF